MSGPPRTQVTDSVEFAKGLCDVRAGCPQTQSLAPCRFTVLSAPGKCQDTPTVRYSFHVQKAALGVVARFKNEALIKH